MTPRPSDEAREALRAARERAAGEPAATEDRPPGAATPPAAAPSAGRAPRPGDVAREALRRAVRARRGTEAEADDADGSETPTPTDRHAPEATGPDTAAPGDEGSGDTGGVDVSPGGVAGSPGREPVSPGTPGEASPGAAAVGPASSGDARDGVAAVGPVSSGDARDGAAMAGPVSSGAGEVTAPSPGAPADGASGDVPEGAAMGGPVSSGDARDGAATAGPAPSGDGAVGVPGEAGRPAARPGDVAREALRSAREEADVRPGRAGTPARRAPSPAPRVPRTTRGDRAADTRTTRGDRAADTRTTRGDRAADTRAREVRSALADAFRLPGTADGPERDPGPGTGAAPTPAAPRDTAPRSMAAPARDGELRRTFPAFPPRTPDTPRFAETWWGDEWVTALEDGALDAARLARGRAYAEEGHVDAITVTPGLVLAYVRGSRPRPYRVQVRLRTFGDAEWERFLDAAAERPGHIAALLDKEMPQSLADCGVPLLPGPGDLAPRCSCPDSGHPCKHAAALCYQTARLLDADPFVLLLLRGRGEREVIDALSRLSAARTARAAQGREPEPLPGVRAAEAVARSGLPPLPAPLPPPPHPEQPPVYPASPGGPDPFALDQLATDAAARAHALLTTGRDPVARLTLWQDAVRLAAARPGSGLTAATRALYSSLARAAGRTPADLARAVAAWRQGGRRGLDVLDEPWDPPAGRFDRARPLLLAADLPAFRPWRNHLTHPRGHVQLRLGRDHLWYAYESEPGHDDWWPRGTPDPDPVGALTGLDTLGDL
ncbi:SWIM zinc finger family protein [Streptomyces sp. NA02536]|uniref:SWIM zinc finger family protein n=1 Tax=Streptomyces sp. NA02536 TaxID=2742133 RepID=UPI00158FA920|nr:SWIM zinc finger family protein [Streptomyces sp. NA02536]QKW03514.1 SWIM zinc finger family protein [Streptomyces sp. NA02536]